MQIDPKTITWDPSPAQAPRGPVYGPAPTVSPAQERTADRADAAEARTAAGQTFRTMSPEEASAQGLPKGGVYQINQLGEVKTISAAPKVEPKQNIASQRERLSRIEVVLENLNRLEELVSTSDMGTGSIVGQESFRAGEDYLGISSLLNQRANDVAGAIEMVQGDLINQVRAEMQESGAPIGVKGADTEKEASRLAASIANLSQTQDEKEFLIGLQRARDYYQRRRAAISESIGLSGSKGNIDAVPANTEPPAIGGSDQAQPPQGPQEPDIRLGAGFQQGDDRQSYELTTELVREDDPVLAGVRKEYSRRLERGDNAEALIKWARAVGIDPSAFPSIQEQVKFRRENPNVPIEQYDTTQLDDKIVNLSAADQLISGAVQSAPGAFVVNAGQAASAFTLDELVGALGGSTERARIGLGELREKNPKSSLAGTVTGGVLSALGGEAGLAAAGVRAGIPRALAADTAFGAAAGAGSSTEGNRLSGALQGGALGGAGSLAGSAVGRGLRNIASGTSNPRTGLLRDEGVNSLTVGQTYGGSGRAGETLKGFEDRLSGIPVIGDAINAQRLEGMRQFNQAAFKRALEPIGGDVGDKVGFEAIEEAQSQVSQAYTKALGGKGATADNEFGKSLGIAVQRTSKIPRIGEELTYEIGEVLRPYKDVDILTGEALDDIVRNLRNIKRSRAGDPLFTRAATAIDGVERAFFDLFDRQASGTVDGYMEARRAYRRLSTIEDAVLRAQNQTDNIFTPAQLGQVDRNNTKRFGGKRAAARGDTPFNELQQAAQDVMPNRVPDSGTAGRMVLPLLALGAGSGTDAAGFTNGMGLTIGAIIAAAYTPQGRRMLTRPAQGMREGTVRRKALESPRTSRAISATGAGALGSSSNQ